MFRLTSKGIERVDPPLVQSEPKDFLSTQAQPRPNSNKAEPKDKLLECKPTVRISEKSRRSWEVIPKKEKLVETNSAPETNANYQSKRYNLRRKSKPVWNSELEDASDCDPTDNEDYQPEPESDPNPRPVKDRQFKCEFCSKVYKAKQTLEGHIIDMHVVDKDFQCQNCSRAFISKKRLDNHISEKHQKLKCTYCTATYRLEKNLQKHMEEHERSGDPYNYKPFKCETCGKGFSSKSDKAKHEVTHGNDKPYKCDHCPKTFVKRLDLGCHVANQHGGVKPYKCPKCPKAFFRERDLINNHLPYHFEDRNFDCDKCLASFKTRMCLRQHINKFCYARKQIKTESNPQIVQIESDQQKIEIESN